MLHIKLAQFAVRCALPPRRSESPVCATDNKPSCVLHLLGWFIGSRRFSSLERRPEFWVLQSNRSAVSDPLWPHGWQHARLPWPSLSPGVHPNPCPLSQWCHPTISSSVTLISSCLQSFPTSGSFPMSWPFASVGQSIRASPSASSFQWIVRVDFL